MGERVVRGRTFEKPITRDSFLHSSPYRSNDLDFLFRDDEFDTRTNDAVTSTSTISWQLELERVR
jgi:hypothetical protein